MPKMTDTCTALMYFEKIDRNFEVYHEVGGSRLCMGINTTEESIKQIKMALATYK